MLHCSILVAYSAIVELLVVSLSEENTLGVVIRTMDMKYVGESRAQSKLKNRIVTTPASGGSVFLVHSSDEPCEKRFFIRQEI